MHSTLAIEAKTICENEYFFCIPTEIKCCATNLKVLCEYRLLDLMEKLSLLIKGASWTLDWQLT